MTTAPTRRATRRPARRRRSARLVRAVAAAGALVVLAAGLADAAGSSAARTPGNPLVGGPWSHSTITTRANPELINHLNETDPQRKAALGRIALTPKARWFANCGGCNVAGTRDAVAAYVADARRESPDALVQLAIFGLWPDGEVVDGKRPAMSWTMQRYQDWIAEIAAGIGDARVAIILEPDLAISANHRGAMKDPTPGVRTSMAAWAAAYLSTTLPRAAIYLDAGSADWLTLAEARRLLLRSGIQHVRGFALGATHYDSVADNVAYAARLSKALAAAGVPGKRAVIDTADNGTPFTYAQWNKRWGPKWRRTKDLTYLFDNTPACRSRKERVCQTIGHRPTWSVVDAEAAKVGLGTKEKKLRAQARRYVDAYLWFGRGWRWMQQGGNDAKTPERSVRMATYTRFR